MRYLAVTWFALLVAAGVMFFGASRAGQLCQGELRELAEPSAWRNWPKVPGDGHFTQWAGGSGAEPKLRVGEAGLCPDEQLAIQVWPRIASRGTALPGWMRSSAWPSFRKNPLGDEWVVSANIPGFQRDSARSDDADEFFMTAFRDVRAHRLYIDVPGAALLAALAVAVAMLARALAFGHLRMRVARRLAVKHPINDTAYRSASFPVHHALAIETQVERVVLRTLVLAGVMVVAGTLLVAVSSVC
jgi:hypothetical protein